MIKGIAIGFFCFLLFLSQIFIFHNFNIKRRFYAMLKIFLYGLLVYVALYILIPERGVQRFIALFIPTVIFSFFNAAFLHFSFCYLYLYFIQIIDRTPTARIMLAIESAPEKKLTLGQIKQSYSLDKKICGELEDMVILGCLKKESHFYINTNKGKMHMRIFRFIRDYLKLRRG
jgi:hypothetical protein